MNYKKKKTLCNLTLDNHVQSVMGHFSCRYQTPKTHVNTIYLSADINNINNNNPLIFER